jgi:hypothetical protein
VSPVGAKNLHERDADGAGCGARSIANRFKENPRGSQLKSESSHSSGCTGGIAVAFLGAAGGDGAACGNGTGDATVATSVWVRGAGAFWPAFATGSTVGGRRAYLGWLGRRNPQALAIDGPAM